MSTRISNVSLFVTMLLAARLAGCGGETGPTTTGTTSTATSSSSGDPNPPTMCDGPGKGRGGEPCLTACDCCALDCRILTELDGSAMGVCSGDCVEMAGTDTQDAGRP